MHVAGTQDPWTVLRRTAAMYKTVERAVQSGASARNAHAALADYRAALRHRLTGETDPDVRAAMLISQLCGVAEDDLEEIDLPAIRAEISPLSPLWAAAVQLIHPGVLFAVSAGDPAGNEYLDTARRQHPDASVRAVLLQAAYWEALADSDHERWPALLLELEQVLTVPQEIEIVRDAAGRLERLRPGEHAPRFSVPALEPSGEVFELDQFAGRYLLIDFWATWCLPCLDDIPGQQAAYARFHNRGLEILSVSNDVSRDDVHSLRSDPATPLPWLHAFAGLDHSSSSMGREFAVFALPRAILLAPDGTIAVEANRLLRGPELHRTLATLLGSE